jgi:trans-2,3-dihydro-3-hydroxyanthranilate isomerase
VTGGDSGEHRFATLDVFTDRPFAGNPVAVVEDADELSDATMLSVAREFGFSETVFLQTATAEGCAISARIFTPAGELPFAGHPTIGTAVWLAANGWVDRDGDRRIVLQELAGPVPVDVEWLGPERVTARFTAPVAPFSSAVQLDVPAAARLVGLRADDMVGEAQMVSAGNPFLALRLASTDALGRAGYDRVAWLDAGEGREDLGAVYLFVAEGTEVRARLFAPAQEIVEDPATGSAAAALAALLAVGRADGTHRWTIFQGIEMGRPSRIELEVEVTEGRATVARVGGTAVVVTRGTLDLGVELGGSSNGSYAS